FTFEQADFPTVQEISTMLFEKPDGSGGPRGLHVVEMNDVERWYAHVQKNLPWDSNILEANEWPNGFWSNDEFNILRKMNGNKKNIKTMSNEYLDFGL